MELDPEQAAVDAASSVELGNGVTRSAFAWLSSNPSAYLEPLQENGYVRPSEVEGYGRHASLTGLSALEKVGVVEKNGTGYNANVDWDDEDYDAFIEELEWQKDTVL